MDYEVIAEHRASFPYSVDLKIGDTVTVTNREDGGWVWCIGHGERSAWIPKAYMNQRNHTATMLVDYTSTELDVVIGEKLTGVKEESSWMFCVNSRGQQGWVPADKLKAAYMEDY